MHRRDPVGPRSNVIVDESKDHRGRGGNAGIAGTRRARTTLQQVLKTLVAFRALVHDGRGAIGRAVVNDQYLISKTAGLLTGEIIQQQGQAIGALNVGMMIETSMLYLAARRSRSRNWPPK